MTAVAKPLPADTSAAEPRLFRLSVERYGRMIDAGLLIPADHVELLDGLLVKQMPHNPPHFAMIRRLVRALERLLPTGWCVRPQGPVELSTSVPEPDVAVARGPEEQYDHRHPNATDLGIVMEVAVTTLATDRGVKAGIYAAARIPVYWIVNEADGVVEVCSRPRGGRRPAYRTLQVYHRGDAVPVVLDGRDVGTIAVDDLLPVPPPGNRT